MSEIDNNHKLNALVDYFLKKGNFDHSDMKAVASVGQRFGVSKFDAVGAFFVAREKASLVEGEVLEGGDGSELKRVKYYGPNSVHEMLFENASRRKK